MDVKTTKEEALKRMQDLKESNGSDRDFESDHINADKILCDFLISLGHQDLVDAFKEVGKWYS